MRSWAVFFAALPGVLGAQEPPHVAEVERVLAPLVESYGVSGMEEPVRAMVQRLLPGIAIAGPDAADALAVAITHAHHLASARSGLTQER